MILHHIVRQLARPFEFAWGETYLDHAQICGSCSVLIAGVLVISPMRLYSVSLREYYELERGSYGEHKRQAA